MPAVAGGAVRVQGLRELNRAFKVADARLAKELRVALRDAAEPVRAEAEQLALSTITRMTVPWSQMRIGVTSTRVYVAPRQRGARQPQRKRPNLAALLLRRSMLPALDHNQAEVVHRLDEMLGTVGQAWEHA